MKNKKIKKYLACFLTATCMMSMLTGCGNTEVKQTEKTEESKKESTEAASTSTENASEESVEEPAGVTYPMENVTLTLALLEESAITSYYNDISETPFGQAWQEATGVTLEVQQYADNAALNLMIASGELPDIIYFDWAKYNGGIYQAVKDGVVAPMSDYAEFSPDYMALLESNDTYRKGATTVDGDVAGFNLFRGDPYLLTSAGLIVRQDFLDKVDMEAPVTADDLYDVLVAFKNELKIEKPLSLTKSHMNILIDHGVITTPFGLPKGDFYVEDGSIHYGCFEAEYKDVLTYLNKLYDEGLLDPEYATIAGSAANANFMNGVSGVISQSVGGGLGTFIATMADDPTWDATGFGPLVTQEGEIPMSTYCVNPVDTRAAVITTACKNKETAAQFLNYAYTEEGHMLFNFGIEGVSYEMVDGYPTYTDVIMNNEEGLSMQQAMIQYHRAAHGAPFVQDKRYMEQYSNYPQQKAALEKWITSNALDYLVPALVIPEEYSSEYDKLWADINTYIAEMRIQYITGLKDLDAFESEYIATLKEMGIERILEIKQMAYEEYEAR